MLRPFSIALALALSACTASQPAAGPTPPPSSPPGAASPSSTPAATPTPRPSASPVAGVLTPSTVTLPSDATISAPSNDVVWALMGGERGARLLFRSTDRGATWEQRPVPPANELTHLSFADAQTGWIMDRGPGCPIWLTTDGGATYTPMGPAGAGRGQCDGALSMDRGGRPGGDAGAQVGYWAASAAENAIDLVLHRTGDGGRSWTAAPIPVADARFDPRTAVAAREVRPFGSTVLVLLTGRFGDEGGEAVFRSNDGGVTWSLVTTVADRPTLTFVTASRWLEVGPSGDHRETTDAGAAWHEFVSDYQQAAPVAPVVVFADEQVGYATVRGSIQRTTDGGAHWDLIPTPGT